MILLKNITKRYGSRIIYENMNLEIKSGDYIHIAGESGTGKSTLLNILGLLDNDFEGQLTIDDRIISDMNDEKISLIRNSEIEFIFQAYNLILI